MTLSFIPGSVAYSWFTPATFTPVTFVPGIVERATLLSEFPRVTP